MRLPTFGSLLTILTVTLYASSVTCRADEPKTPADTLQPVPAVPDVTPADTTPSTIVQQPASFQYTGEREKNWPKPTPTLLKSMIVPGWGQLTNRKYVKAAVAFGLETWYIGNMIHHWRKSNQYLDAFRANPNDLTAFNNYEFHRGNRNDYMWWLGITIFVSMFDAYVDAHLRPYEHDRIPDIEPPPGIAVVIKSF